MRTDVSTGRADVSVVVSSYNRSGQLRRTLDALLAQRADGLAWEAVIVDNNSTDDTRAVVQSFIDRREARLSYVFEPRQGLSFGRNTGIAHATAPLIAFTDDDIQPAPDWLAEIKRAFDDHAGADFVGGKVLPRWESAPAGWLTPDHWSPLALVDYGSDAFVVDAHRPLCLVGANFAFRREVFQRLGPFSIDLQRVKNGIGSAEDYEMAMRVWRAGGHGLYIPSLVVISDVAAERTTKAYHRRWYAGHGRFSAMLRLKDCTSPDGRLVDERTQASRLFGVPSFVYLELVYSIGRWTNAAIRGTESSAFYHENRVRHCVSYIRQRYLQDALERRQSHVAELAQFVATVVRKRVGARAAGSQPSA